MNKICYLKILVAFSSCAKTRVGQEQGSLVIQEQGSFAIGGTILTNPGTFDPYHPSPEGQTLHGDHAYVFYQVPVNARKLPLIFWHGAGQFSKTWGTTPDGREGFQNIFLRRGYKVYLIDQPRRGNAGRSTVGTNMQPVADDQSWFDLFRIGIWPNYFPGVQFAKDPETLNQYFRQMTPDTGPFDLEVVSDAVSELFNKIGTGILVTHSRGGGPGWLTAIKNPNVRAVISFESGSYFVFPAGEMPTPRSGPGSVPEAIDVPMEDFMKLTQIPIIIYFGDYIPAMPTLNPGQDFWRVRLEIAKLWRDAVNRHGGNVTIVILPEIGIYGNTHFPFSDLNNLQIADLVSDFLKENGLDN
jgi:hypothetical protein